MKKILTLSLLAILFICCASIFSACRSDETTSDIFSASQDNEIASDISENLDECGFTFKTLTVENTTVYGSVANSVDTFSFIDEIETTGNINFIVSLDIYGIQSSATKTIPLEIGDNTVYIIEMKNDIVYNIYTVTIRRRPMYNVTFNTNGGAIIQPQIVEEGDLADEPKMKNIRLGYNFKGWDYNFALPITNDIKITALVEIKEEMLPFKFSSTLYSCEINGLNDDSIKDVYIPDYVTKIEKNAFRNCDNLFSVIIDANLREIYSHTFFLCSNLTSVILPDNVTSIGESAFYCCEKLTTITIPDNVKSIGARAFSGCFSLTSLTIPNGVTSINEYTFSGCTSLTNLTIPDGVTNIGYYAFEACDNLSSVTLPNSVTTIDNGAFSGCDNLTDVYITDITMWHNISFGNSGANPLCNAGNLYLNNELITELIIPDGITSIGDYLFSGWNSLSNLIIPNSITRIGNGAFASCDNLTNVIIGNAVTNIGAHAFANCDNLINVVIGDAVTELGSYAFTQCKNLISLTLGENVENIGESAFEYCYKLVEIVNRSSKITITKGSSSNGYAGYYALGVHNGKDAYTSKLSNDGGYLVYIDSLNKILIGYTGMETDLLLPSYITKINQCAFYDCDNLISVLIGDNVTSIGDMTFLNCDGLKNIVIPDSVTNIGDSVFRNCDNLISVQLGENISSIGSYVFYNCSSLTSIIIPGSVTSIGRFTFVDCNALTSIIFENTSTWYRIDSANQWENKVHGTTTNVTNASTNVTYFTSKYDEYYWYKN